jgi:hypothetical protein
VQALEQTKMSCHELTSCPGSGIWQGTVTDGDRMQISETKGITPSADLVNPLTWLIASI